MEINAAALKALREARGLSISALAIAAGVKQPHLSNIEAGRRQPSEDLMRALAAALNVPLQAIVLGRL